VSVRLLATLAPVLASTIMTVAGLVLFAIAPRERVPVGLHFEETFPFIAMQLSLGMVGLAVAWRHPLHPIGWLLSFGALAASFEYFAAAYMTYGLLSDTGLPAADVAAWFWTFGGSLLAAFIGPLVFLFPDGRLPSRRARAGLLISVAATVVLASVLAFRPGPLLGVPFAKNPFGWREGAHLLDLALNIPIALVFIALVLAVSSIRERSRQGTDLERQQLKWLYGGMALFLMIYALAIPALFSDAIFGFTVEPIVSYVARLGAGLAIAIIPLAIGIAVLRYRLYDIDLLIKRTVAYGATSAAIAISFFVGIIALQQLLRPLTSGTEIAVAASTLVSFALFQPIRRRVQDAVDHRFDRSRYDAARTLDAFADRLRDEVDLDALRSDLMGSVRHTMGPAYASLWLRETR
jgi:hypothetical protein